MDLTRLDTFLNEFHQPSYRFRQIKKNYFSSKYSTFKDMTDLSLELRHHLDQKISLYSVVEDKLVVSPNTQKARLKLNDGNLIETVLMDYGGWLTACVSSQVGCPLKCAFCATGQMGFKRNLSSEEIVDQVLYWNHKLYPRYIGRLVYMGMGEPFLNWDNLLESIKLLNSPDGLNLGARKISISTAGIVPQIIEFANLGSESNLAISLHAPDQASRLRIMPIAKQYSFEELTAAALYYVNRTRRQLFFEYALIKGINDTPSHLSRLIRFLNLHHLFYLNLIPLNQVSGGLSPSLDSVTKAFYQELMANHIEFSVRQSFGSEIQSACGQLIIT